MAVEAAVERRRNDRDVRKFQEHYPEWKFRYGLREILEEIYEAVKTENRES